MSTRRQRSKKSMGPNLPQGQGRNEDKVAGGQPVDRHALRQHPRKGFEQRTDFLDAVRSGEPRLFPDVVDPERFAIEGFIDEVWETFPDAGFAHAAREAEKAYPSVEISPTQKRDIKDDLEGVDLSHGRTRRRGQRGGRHVGRRLTYLLGSGVLPGDGDGDQDDE